MSHHVWDTLVFVDELSKRGIWRWGASSHLLPGNPESQASLDTLHIFARQMVGLKPEWYQEKSRWPHYDVASRLRKSAVDFGAVEISTRGYLKMQKLRQYREFKESTGAVIKLGSYYIVGEDGEYYSGRGYPSVLRATEAAMRMRFSYQFDPEDIAVPVPTKCRTGFDKTGGVNIFSADDLLVFTAVTLPEFMEVV